MENKRIQFDWEKYQSGEFEAVCRDGSKPEMITYNPNAITNLRIAFWVNGQLESCDIEGIHLPFDNYKCDLFLIPKPKKFQAWVNLYSNGAAVTWSHEDSAEQYQNMNEGFIKTILIEWEG